jgi:hypothetical protein
MPQRNCLLIIAYLLTIESSHGILIRNRDEIVEKIGPLVTNAQQALFAADQIDSWVIDSLASGDVVMPGYIIHQIVEQLETPRKNTGFCHPVLSRYGICP